MIEAKTLGRFEFCKYHALGNDYLVVDGRYFDEGIKPADVKTLCHRSMGIGSDGVLVICAADAAREQCSGSVHAGLRIFNPDGSEAEKSGNGLRIFARALYDLGLAAGPEVRVQLGEQLVDMQLLMEEGPEGALPRGIASVRVAMGAPSFCSTDIGMDGAAIDTSQLILEVRDERCDVTAVSMGNPHCVVFAPQASLASLRRLGPLIERHPRFLRRTNVQLARVVARDHIEIFIWERGAGETSASGSSSCAVVAAAQKRGLVDRKVTVTSPGGALRVEQSLSGELYLQGPATPVCRGFWHPLLLSHQKVSAA